MARLPRIADLKDQDAGWGFYLCARKDRRQGRTGLDLLDLLLQDASGEIGAKVLKDVDALSSEFDAGEFVKVQGRANVHHGRMEIVVEKIRRAHASTDAADGFREDGLHPGRAAAGRRDVARAGGADRRASAIRRSASS